METSLILSCICSCSPCILITLPISGPIMCICLSMYFLGYFDEEDNSVDDSDSSGDSNTGLIIACISVLCSIIITIIALFILIRMKK